MQPPKISDYVGILVHKTVGGDGVAITRAHGLTADVNGAVKMAHGKRQTRQAAGDGVDALSPQAPKAIRIKQQIQDSRIQRPSRRAAGGGRFLYLLPS